MLGTKSPPKTKLTGRRSGYSLLEVILATAILAGSSLVLASMISAGARLGNRAQSRIEAMLVAQTLVDETLALRQGEVFEEEDLFGEGTRWTYSLRTEADEESGMIAVTAEVFSAEMTDGARLNVSETLPAARLVRWYLPRVAPATDQLGMFEAGRGR